MGIFNCRHEWGFPRRLPEFKGELNVDVQTCAKCGARRMSRIQFGLIVSAPEQAARPEEPRAEVTA